MARPTRSRRRYRVGSVSVYQHHGAWWLYFRDDGKPRRRRIGPDLDEAKTVAAQVTADLAAKRPTMLSFEPVSIPILRRRWLDYHENVIRSSLPTVRRYTTASAYLEEFADGQSSLKFAHDVVASDFITYLRSLRVAPNGHANTPKRPLRDKGIQFIAGVCRSMYSYAGKNRLLPPYADNPFSVVPIERLKIEDAKPIHVFSQDEELQFFDRCDDWQFPIFFILAKVGLRPGELSYLLIEDIDLDKGMLHIRNKPELGWQIKTRNVRSIPMTHEVHRIFQHVIDSRKHGVVLQRRGVHRSKNSCLVGSSRSAMAEAYLTRSNQIQNEFDRSLTRLERKRIADTVWRDAGALRSTTIRNEFIRLTEAMGLPEVTAPKCWRHTFATCMQEAGVDPLVRQLTMGHVPAGGGASSLGMTATYTHTPIEFHRDQLQSVAALRPATTALFRRKIDGKEQQ